MIAAAAASATSTTMSNCPSWAANAPATSAVSPGTGMPIVSIAMSPNTAAYPTFEGIEMIDARTSNRTDRAYRRSRTLAIMRSDEIRETFLSYFEARDHRRLRSASLAPATFDPSVLLTTAGMHPLKPYFLGVERAPHHRLTTCQKCFRTPDIDQIGLTTRHLT